MDAVLEAANSGMVLARRIGVEPENLCLIGANTPGYDLFVFNTDNVKNTNFDGIFTIGSPWWDYWFPLAYHEAGGKLLSPPSHILLHLEHPAAYSKEKWVANAEKIYRHLAQNGEWRKTANFPDIFRTANPSPKKLFGFAIDCFDWLESTSEKIQLTTNSSILFSTVLNCMNDLAMADILKLNLVTARSNPVKNMRRFIKWKSSELLALAASVFSEKAAVHMKRRAKKNSPCSGLSEA